MAEIQHMGVAGQGTEMTGQEFMEYDEPMNENPYAYPDSESSDAVYQGEEENGDNELENETGSLSQETPETLTPEELKAVRERLYTERQAQMQGIEQAHQQRLQQLAQQEQLMLARQQAMAIQNQPEETEFEKAVNAAVNARLNQTVAPEMQKIRGEMQAQQAQAAIQSTLHAGMNDVSMPNFDQISGLAISRYGRDVVINRIMTSNPADAARWMYNLGLAEAKAVPMVNQAVSAPAQVQAQARQTQKASLPRGMQVQGGAKWMSDADWGTLDKKIDNMSIEQITEFKKNPKNLQLFERMLRYGTTNPNAAKGGN
jgi:hypothetical protein